MLEKEELLFLVTRPGERHEDHIPVGIYNIDQLIATFNYLSFEAYD
jgi:hypothetical protein